MSEEDFEESLAILGLDLSMELEMELIEERYLVLLEELSR